MFNFYMLIFYFKHFVGNIYTNTISLALADIFSYLVSGIVIKRTSAKKAMLTGYFIQTIGSVLYLSLRTKEPLVPFIIVLSRIGISMAN